MPKSATDIMHDIIVSAVNDAVQALKAASKGLPNTLLRDINAIHANTTFDDLPPEVKAAISTNVRSAFNRLLKEGYTVADRNAPQPVRPPSPPRGERRGPPPARHGRDKPRPKGPPKGR